MKKIIILLILFTSFFLKANSLYYKSSLINLGRSSTVLGLGGVIYGLNSQDGAVMDNIALSAGLLRYSLNIAGGLTYNVPNFRDINQATDGVFFFPNSYGVFSVHYQNFIENDNGFTDTFLSLGFGFSKEILKELLFGSRVMIDYYNFKDEIDRNNTLGMIFDLNLIYKFAISRDSSFFVFKDFVLGIGVRNIGYVPSVTDDSNDKLEILELKQMDLIRVGIGFDFIEVPFPEKMGGGWVSRLMVDGSFHYPFNGGMNIGWKNSFKFNKIAMRKIYISSGYFYNPDLKFKLPVTLGLGLNFVIDKSLEFDISYAILFESKVSTSEGILHKISFDFRFGEVDEAEPEIDTSSFSEKGVIQGEIIK